MLNRFAKSLFTVVATAFIAVSVSRVWADTDDLKIPNLGASSTSLYSEQYERRLGSLWLKVFRAQAPVLDDPLLADYIENLIFELVLHSDLRDRQLQLVVVDNPTINAFAVPGGIIGVHNGLIHHAQSEDELAAVLAHEIAHLSQRHFSRQREQAANRSKLTIAGLMAGIVLAATAGSDAGLAAMTATQAAAQDSRLRYSRANESEADRIGLKTLVASGRDPHAAADMHERMLSAHRLYSTNRLPEFLRTHPLSEKRVADMRNRARSERRVIRPKSFDFELMQARVRHQLAQSPVDAVNLFRDQTKRGGTEAAAGWYGLSLAYIDSGQPVKARQALEQAMRPDPNNLTFVIASSEIDTAMGQHQRAITRLKNRLSLSPGNHPLTIAYADALWQAGLPHVAAQLLKNQSKKTPEDPGVWYRLAEVQGLAGDIIGLHQSRAEYFILVGALDSAQNQLNYALKLVNNNFTQSATINERLRDVMDIRDELENS
jgi:predicted Zn-dependent protease